VPKSISYSREALKTLQRIDRKMAARIVVKIEQLASNPASLANNVKALKGGDDIGGPLMRLRVGDWRIIYRDGVVIAVIRVAPRGAAYE
jgi:mRNA interferase RelE/StbE